MVLVVRGVVPCEVRSATDVPTLTTAVLRVCVRVSVRVIRVCVMYTVHMHQ